MKGSDGVGPGDFVGVNGPVIGQSQRQGRVPARCCFVKDLTLYGAAYAREGFVVHRSRQGSNAPSVLMVVKVSRWLRRIVGFSPATRVNGAGNRDVLK
jgi:hypothetical protein